MSGDAALHVGVLQLEVGFEGVRSLKEKRALLLPLLEGWRRSRSLSVVRLAGGDAHGWERFALAALDHDVNRLRGALQAAAALVARQGLSVRCSRLDIEEWEPLSRSDAGPWDA
jgi:uncharacterized protein YlxP (DUF503 family)